MPLLFIIFLLIFALNSDVDLSEASHEKKLPSAVIVGTVYCDTCFQDDLSKNSHIISGATVAVECKEGNSRPSFRRTAKTDERGEFRVDLPFSVSKHARKIKRCSVKLLSSSEPYCAVASTATSSSIHLKSRKQGIHIFSAGFFTFKPQNQPNLCNQKPSIRNSKQLRDGKTSVSVSVSVPPLGDPTTFPPPVQDPTKPELPPVNENIFPFPPIPLLPKLPPLPQLPPLPPLPGLPNLPPIPGKTPEAKPDESLKRVGSKDQKVEQSELLPNPFPLPPLFPPNPFQPPPSPLIPLPPIPGLTPSPPSPSFPFPFPLFPFPPSPTSSSSSQRSSP